MHLIDITNALSTEQPRAPWAIVHARPRQEKRLACDLERLGLDPVLPTVRIVRVYAHRRRVVHLPLFPSSVFVRAHERDFEAIESTGRVVRLWRPRNPCLLERELEYISQALAAEARLEPCDAPRGGEPVRMVDGPLSGLEGRLVREPQAWLVLPLTELERAVRVPVEPGAAESLAAATTARAEAA